MIWCYELEIYVANTDFCCHGPMSEHMDVTALADEMRKAL